MKKKSKYHQSAFKTSNFLPYRKYLCDIETNKNIYAESNVFKNVIFWI